MRFSLQDAYHLEQQSRISFQNNYEIAKPNNLTHFHLFAHYSANKTDYDLIAYAIGDQRSTSDLNLNLFL